MSDNMLQTRGAQSETQKTKQRHNMAQSIHLANARTMVSLGRGSRALPFLLPTPLVLQCLGSTSHCRDTLHALKIFEHVSNFT